MNPASRSPLLSVVIPTCKRPHLLGRAIESALLAAPDGDVEVIVVPNGPDESWKAIATLYRNNNRVRWQPTTVAHANVARNHGLSISNGKYIRFLDDDDYFLGDQACAQLLEAIRTNSKLSVAPISAYQLESNSLEGEHSIPYDFQGDFTAFVLNSKRITLPTAYVFDRDVVIQHRWDESLRINQDTKWMLDIAARFEGRWTIYNRPVGVWLQHKGERVSSDFPVDERMRIVLGMLRECMSSIPDSKINDLVRLAYSDGLWRCAHTGFPFEPTFWSRVMREALALSPSYKPPQPIFRAVRFLDPLIVEWALLPIKKALLLLGMR